MANIYNDIKNINENNDLEGTKEPISGVQYDSGLNIFVTPGKKLQGKIVVKYFVGNMDSEVDKLEAEAIATKSLECRDLFHKIGDIIMLSENSTFDKTGTYHLVIKYMEIIEKEASIG